MHYCNNKNTDVIMVSYYEINKDKKYGWVKSQVHGL